MHELSITEQIVEIAVRHGENAPSPYQYLTLLAAPSVVVTQTRPDRHDQIGPMRSRKQGRAWGAYERRCTA